VINRQSMVDNWQGEAVLGERMTTDLFERRFYAEDMAPVPSLLVRPFFRTLPDAVARPRSTGEVAEAVRQAVAYGLPIVPRAAATTALFNIVPVRGGLVLDLNELTEVVAVDEMRGTVTVGAGTRWLNLERALQPYGLALKSYPSSAVVATVGGWLSTQGHGLGSLKYGPLLNQVVQAKVVLPEGQIRQVTSDSTPPLDWFAAAEGTLGVLTEIELKVRLMPKAAAHYLLCFDSLPDLQRAMVDLARAEPRPYTLLFSDEIHAQMLALAGFPPPTTQPAMLVSYQGEVAEVAQGQSRLAGLPGEALAVEAALEEWNDRLYHLRVKRGGPSLLAAEMWLPIEALADYLVKVNALSQRFRVLIGNYGLAVSPHEAMVMSVYHCDACRTLDYTLALGLMGHLYRLGARCGGRPYGVGLWNTPYLSQIFSRQHLRELRARKQVLDPAGRLNPGKLYRAPFPLWPALFKPGTGLLAAAYRWQRNRTNTRERVDE
jgi:FAD/FMN-containing dehydrogenase